MIILLKFKKVKWYKEKLFSTHLILLFIFQILFIQLNPEVVWSTIPFPNDLAPFHALFKPDCILFVYIEIYCDRAIY